MGLGLIKKVLTDGVPLSCLEEHGIFPGDFNSDEKRVYDYISSHFQEHGSMPQIKIVEAETQANFNDLPDEVLEYWVGQVRDRTDFYLIGKARGKISEALGKGETQKAKDIVKNLNEKLESFHVAVSRPQGFTAKELIVMDLPEVSWTVENILPEGLALYVGKPKTGKSITALNIGIAVSRGDQVLGDLEVQQGSVIYLALEDTKARLQYRLITILEGKTAPENLHLCPEWPRMGQGGIAQLEQKIKEHDNVVLVIVDTLAKFKPVEKKRNVDSYDQDYQTMSRIKTLADKYSISILVVHHLRKQGSSDIFDTVSGTLGLTGACDSTLILNRNRLGQMELHLTGRDIEQAEYAMEFNKDNLTWRIVGRAYEIKSTERKQKLYDALKGATEPLSPKQLAEITGLRQNYVSKALPRLMEEGNITRLDRGLYIYSGKEGKKGKEENKGKNGKNGTIEPDTCSFFPEGTTDGKNYKDKDNNELEPIVPILPIVPVVPTDSSETDSTAEETEFKKMAKSL